MSAMKKTEVRPHAKRMPAENIPADKAPGHWILARLGKKVLRPGGLALTRKMIEALRIRPSDRVVEFAPGLGITARMTLGRHPASYTAIERDQDAAEQVRQYLHGDNQRCVTASAHETGLPEQCADVVYGEAMLSMQPEGRKLEIMREAMLSMQPEGRKLEIMREATRLLPSGGRYAIHELCMRDVTETLQAEIHEALCHSLHVGATPLTQAQWTHLLEEAGFRVLRVETAPMALLEPGRILKDEGVFRSLKILFRLLNDTEARIRVGRMRSIFRKYSDHLAAILFVAEKI